MHDGFAHEAQLGSPVELCAPREIGVLGDAQLDVIATDLLEQ